MHNDNDFTNPPGRRTGALGVIRDETGAVLMVQKDPMVFLAKSAPLYGFHGTIYGLNTDNEVHVVAKPDQALPFGHPNLPTLLASQLIRRLSSFHVVGMDELTHELTALAA